MASQFTTVRQVAEAVGAEQRRLRYPHLRFDFYPPGMGHYGSSRGMERRYWVNLGDGRVFEGYKAQLLEWAALHLRLAGEATP